VELKPTLAVSLNKVQNTGLGNQYDLVGRFFMEHPLLISGKLLFSSPAALYTQRNIRVGEVFIGIALGLSKAVQEREQILNFSARPLPILPDWVKLSTGCTGLERQRQKSPSHAREFACYGGQARRPPRLPKSKPSAPSFRNRQLPIQIPPPALKTVTQSQVHDRVIPTHYSAIAADNCPRV